MMMRTGTKSMEAQSASSEGVSRRVIQRRRLTRRDMERMMLPSKFWKTVFRRIPERNRGELEKYIRGLGNLCDPGEAMKNGFGIVIWGDNDGGKTSAATVVLKEARRRGFTGLFIGALNYRSGVIERVPFDEDCTLKERCSTVDMLVLDDLGKETSGLKSSGGSERIFEDLIRDRCNNLRPTIITTNIDPHRILEEKYSKSFARLMSESFVMMKMVGPSQREIEKKNLVSFIEG